MNKTVVIGLGNPILSDDAVGLHVVRALGGQLAGEDGIDIKEMHAGGIRLIEALSGYDKALIVDAMLTGSSPGTVRFMEESDLGHARNTASTHDITLTVAVDMGRMLGLDIPAEIKVLGIEARDVGTFDEALSEDVAASIPQALSLINRELGL